mmetsp:Transcript_8613/g.12481  ORF Transcript_8613/g.12481 Transcript_8613/m.12481 type:complete len:511 (+) Transcript_8613:410-1942(+)
MHVSRPRRIVRPTPKVIESKASQKRKANKEKIKDCPDSQRVKTRKKETEDISNGEVDPPNISTIEVNEAKKPAAKEEDFNETNRKNCLATDKSEIQLGGKDNVKGESDPIKENSAKDDHEDDTGPKFKFRQRVFAKDAETGLLYEATVRRLMYGVQHQRQLNVAQVSSEADVQAFFDQEPIPEWHYFVHYNGWNVKWDRWVPEQSLYEPTESTRAFAKRLNQAVYTIRKQLRTQYSGKVNNMKVASLLERSMAQLEREHRLEERRTELASKGIEMKQEEEEALMNQNQQQKQKRSKWTKGNIRKEITLRGKHLQGRRKHSELLILPTSLKKVMVEEWEIITQCGMLPNLPVPVTVRDALERYYESKTSKVETEPRINNVSPKKTKNGGADSPEKSSEAEYREMVDGIAIFFDQALPDRLLYQPEYIQAQALPAELSKLRNSEVYGCEHLLRMFVRLPLLLMEELTEVEARVIINRVKDFVRFLQKNHNEFFCQSHRRYNAEEIALQQQNI